VEIEVRPLVPELARGRIAQLVEHLSYKQEVAGSSPALLTSPQADSSAGEHLSDTQEAAGSTPAPPMQAGANHVTVAQPG
jgi:hypothetical protein